jgi:Arc/MetJ-type ribon-helix-helix transcriptional regulator
MMPLEVYEHMGTTARVTVTLPAKLVEEIDRLEKNRSKFILEGVRRELRRRRREALERSLRSPHPETSELAEEGFTAWADGLPEEDVADLVDLEAGTEVRWIPDQGWVEGEE